MPKNSYSSTKTIFDNLFSSHKHQLLKEVESKLQGRAPTAVIFTPNLEQLALAGRQKRFAQALGLANFLLPDGMGLVWGSHLLAYFGKSKSVSERISGREVVLELLNLLKNQQITALIIGGKNYDRLITATKVASAKAETEEAEESPPLFKLNLDPPLPQVSQNQLYWTPGLQKVKNPSPPEQQRLLDLISKLKPAIIFVALGAPDQEHWIIDNQDKLTKAGVKIAMAVGGSFDVIFGKLKQPPRWVEQIGLEWLYRLWQEPWRWRRQLQLFVALKLIIQLALRDDDDHPEG